MSDNEFENTKEGSLTYPKTAGNLKKGEYMLMKGNPVKITEIKTSKPGKHGHAKCVITGIDIFTNKKIEDTQSSSHNVDCPNIKKNEMELISIDEDDYVTLVDEEGEYKTDLALPKDEEEMVEKIKNDFDNNMNLILTVISAMNKEKIITVRRDTRAN